LHTHTQQKFNLSPLRVCRRAALTLESRVGKNRPYCKIYINQHTTRALLTKNIILVYFCVSITCGRSRRRTFRRAFRTHIANHTSLTRLQTTHINAFTNHTHYAQKSMHTPFFFLILSSYNSNDREEQNKTERTTCVACAYINSEFLFIGLFSVIPFLCVAVCAYAPHKLSSLSHSDFLFSLLSQN